MKIIGVIGGSQCTREEYELAREVGGLLAKAGAAVICGGGGGIMEAVCKGAWEEHGITIGILPSDDISEANKFVKIPVATGMGIGRNIIIVRTAQSLIAINGRYGTLSEISFALQLEKPVIAIKPWIELPGVIIVKTPQEAVTKALHLNNKS
jgi:uncharacterized protein (TIGR00725 family)